VEDTANDYGDDYQGGGSSEGTESLRHGCVFGTAYLVGPQAVDPTTFEVNGWRELQH